MGKRSGGRDAIAALAETRFLLQRWGERMGGEKGEGGEWRNVSEIEHSNDCDADEKQKLLDG